MTLVTIQAVTRSPGVFSARAAGAVTQSLRGGRFDRNANSVRVFACSFSMMRLM